MFRQQYRLASKDGGGQGMQNDLDNVIRDPTLSLWAIGVLAAVTFGGLGAAGMKGIGTGVDGGVGSG